jgi:hypothetical protein
MSQATRLQRQRHAHLYGEGKKYKFFLCSQANPFPIISTEYFNQIDRKFHSRHDMKNDVREVSELIDIEKTEQLRRNSVSKLYIISRY